LPESVLEEGDTLFQSLDALTLIVSGERGTDKQQAENYEHD
jgi:hypothetical protein